MANKILTFIQLKIGGVAEHSKLTFNNYLETHKPTICCLNETKRQLDKDFAVNYITESTCRGVRNDGVAIIISKDLSYTRLNELELKDYDSIWILTVVAGLKILIGTAYLKPNETAQMEKFIKQSEKVVNFYHQHNHDGVLFLGDCNARDCSWGDSVCNPNGYLLLESLSAEDNIHNNGEATFLSSNGSSVIDLCIVSGRIATQVGFELTTDPIIELFTGAPQRGHIPLIVKCNLSRSTEEENTKPWLQKADWEAWQNVLEESSHASIEAVQRAKAIDQWGSVLFDISEATGSAIPYKRSSRHSKPFWSEDLSQKSAELRALRKKLKYCSNYSNGERLNTAKNEFKSLLSEKSSEWMRGTLTKLSYRKGKDFWQQFRFFLQMRECTIGPLQSSDGRLATSKEEISEELRKTLFLGQHLKGRSFDEDHYAEVTRKVRNQDPQINAEHDEELFDEDFSMHELECAIKNVPQSDAFDNDGIHASMLKRFGIRMKLRLLKLFNSCWYESTWPWNSSRVIFIKKPGKSIYSSNSSYRPLTLSSHVGKLFEKK